jgi:hypothetical protein
VRLKRRRRRASANCEPTPLYPQTCHGSLPARAFSTSLARCVRRWARPSNPKRAVASRLRREEKQAQRGRRRQFAPAPWVRLGDWFLSLGGRRSSVFTFSLFCSPPVPPQSFSFGREVLLPVARARHWRKSTRSFRWPGVPSRLSPVTLRGRRARARARRQERGVSRRGCLWGGRETLPCAVHLVVG